MIPAPFHLRRAEPRDEPAAYNVCVETGNNGLSAAHKYADDPRALGRIFVGPYLALEPQPVFPQNYGEFIELINANSRARGPTAFFRRLTKEMLITPKRENVPFAAEGDGTRRRESPSTHRTR